MKMLYVNARGMIIECITPGQKLVERLPEPFF